jgi:hypothetical protein
LEFHVPAVVGALVFDHDDVRLRIDGDQVSLKKLWPPCWPAADAVSTIIFA